MLAINQQIAAARTLSLEELVELNEFVVSRIKEKRAHKARVVKRRLHEGVKVSFQDNTGQTLTGEVIKVMRKFAQVKVDSCTWRVPMNMLTIK